MQRRAFLIALASALAGCGRAGPRFSGIDLTGVGYGRDFHLRDSEGNPRSLADYRGHYVMLFFGFTRCPDVCPTTLGRAVDVKKRLGADAARLQVLFVTIDPERDTAEVLRAYMQAFDPTFVGLRGDLAATKATADEFHAFYRKSPTGSSYTMDHTSLSYVFDAQGKLRLALRHEQSAEQVAADLRTLIDSSSSN